MSGPQAAMALASPIEGFPIEQPVADPAGPDHEPEVAAEGHQLFDHDDTGQDDVGALRLEPRDAAALPGSQGLESLAHRDHLRLPEPEAMTGLARSPLSAQVEASQRSHRPTQTDQLLSARRRGEGAEESAANLSPELPELAGRGRVVEEEAPGEAQGSEGEAGDGDDLAGAEARDLEAPAPEVGDDPGPERQGPPHGDRPEARLLASAQHAHLYPVGPTERSEQLLPVHRVPDGGRRHGQDPGARLLPVPHLREKAPHDVDGLLDGPARQGSRPPRTQPRLHPLLPQHVEAVPRSDPREDQPDRVRSPLDEG